MLCLILYICVSVFDLMPPLPGLCDENGTVVHTGISFPGKKFGIENPESRIFSTDYGVKTPPSLSTAVVLFDFSDQTHNPSHTASSYDELLFSPSNPGSMYSYYREVSYGQFSVNGVIVDWVRSYYPKMAYAIHYYGIEWIFDPYTQNTSIGVYMAVRDAVYRAEATGFDLNSLDPDGDRVAHGLFVVHAGPGAEQTGDTMDIWSHKADARELCQLIRDNYDPSCPYIISSGCTLGVYSMEPEENEDGSLVTVGVFCHEFCHVLGAPDLYNTDEGNSVVGRFELMDAGSWNKLSGEQPGTRPAHPSLWIKMLLGWVNPDSIERDVPGVPDLVKGAVLDAAGGPTMPKDWRVLQNPYGVDWTDYHPGTGEYFIMENRFKTGFFEIALPDEGIAVWHIDESRPDNNDGERRLVSLVKASGDPSTSTLGEEGDLFSSSTYELGSREVPSPYLWDGTPSGVKMKNMSSCAQVMFADIEAGPVLLGKVFSYPNPFEKHSYSDFCTIKYQPIGERAEGMFPLFRVIIFNIAGEVVRILDDPSEITPVSREAIWDGRNEDSDEVSSGMYLYIIELTPFSEERNFGRITFIH
ncbi:M6 family metalloprotease domain-containing protein [candidate division WOR-3 bacterium]|nr:M6 family metalloprotease domain-containing protein [candidate division WOR-3 bacterium]